jgi:hypothetical protein
MPVFTDPAGDPLGEHGTKGDPDYPHPAGKGAADEQVTVKDERGGVIHITTPVGFVVMRTRREKGAEQDAEIPKGFAAVEWIETHDYQGEPHRGEKLYRSALQVAHQRGLKGLASFVGDRNHASAQVWKRMVAAGAAIKRVDTEEGGEYDVLTAMPEEKD